MKMKLTVAKAPCKSCPYRRDVPSGVWAKNEYDKLPKYDQPLAEQAMTEGTGIFMCHQQDGRICAGWVGTHGAHNLLSLRLAAFYETGPNVLDESVFEYESPVPLFSSGAEAAAHGRKDIRRPKAAAKRVVERLVRQKVKTPRRFK